MVQSDQVKLESFARARKKEKVKKEIQRLAYTHKETSPEEKLEKELEVGQTPKLFQSAPDSRLVSSTKLKFAL